MSGVLLQGVLNALQLGLDLNRVQRLGLEGSDDNAGLLVPILHDQPPRRLGQEVDGQRHDEREDDGDGDGRAPRHGARVVLEEAEVDPRLERVAQADEQAVNNNVPTPVLGARRLALPHGDDGAHLANAEPDDDAADDELREAEGRGLENEADERAHTGEEDDVAPAEPIAGPGAGQGTDHGADDEGRDDEALEGGVGALLGAGGVDRVDLGEQLDPVFLGQQAAQAGLVVTEGDEGGHHDQGRLEYREAVAHGTQELDGLA